MWLGKGGERGLWGALWVGGCALGKTEAFASRSKKIGPAVA